MKRFMNAEALRYLFIGVCTTLVNLIVFTVLCKLVHMDVNLANFISIVTAILFAYVTNKLYVFRSHCASVGELASECVKFCGARVATMAIDGSKNAALYAVAILALQDDALRKKLEGFRQQQSDKVLQTVI